MGNTLNRLQLRKPSIRAHGGSERRMMLNRAHFTDDGTEAIDDTATLRKRLKRSQSLLTSSVRVKPAVGWAP